MRKPATGRWLQEKLAASAATKRFAGSAFTVRLLRYNLRELNSVLTQTQPVTARSNRRLARIALVVAAIGALWFLLYRELSGEWSVNEQYNYGWFVPFLVLFLFWLRWEDRPDPEVRSQRSETANNRRALVASLIAVPALLLLLPIRLFEIGIPEWRPLGWIHAASVATLTLLYIWSAGGLPWLRHFAFPVFFIFVAVPWVTPIEVPIIQGLMRVVATVAAETVALFGIPAQLQGNLIRIPSGVVGINEACSGVRSLQTALMIGLLVGELKRLPILRRTVLVAGAIAIAIAANFCRAVFLVWIAAKKNISEVNSWHDIAGYTIVALVFVGTLIFATLLGRKKAEARNQKSEVRGQRSEVGSQHSYFLLPTFYFLLSLCWLAFVEIGCEAWYRAHERNLVAATRWDVQWPQNAPNFHELKIDEYVRRMLRFDQGHGASWTWPTASSPATWRPSNSKTLTCLLYLFRWNAGRNSALLANLHRPDVCLPATGWHQVADTGVRTYPVANSFALPFRHFEFRRGTPGNSTQMAHAFYCLSENHVPSASGAGPKLPQMAGAPSIWTRSERIRQVLEGRRHLGQQEIEVVFISREQIPAADAESRLGELVREVVRAKPASQ
jgi:exosortase